TYEKRFGVHIKRTVHLSEDTLLVSDEILFAKRNLRIKQIWNTPESIRQIDQHLFEIGPVRVHSNGRGKTTTGALSRYYFLSQPIQPMIFETDTQSHLTLKTQITWTPITIREG